MSNSGTKDDWSKTDVIPKAVKTSLLLFQSELQSCGAQSRDIMVVGAIAYLFYGRPRYSIDLDIAVALKSESTREALFSVIKNQHRYAIILNDRQLGTNEPNLDSSTDFDKINLIKLRDKDTQILIDILLVKPQESQCYGLDDQAFARARREQIGDNQIVYVPSAEDFILMKLVARRPVSHDYEDMYSVLVGNYENLDWAHLRQKAKKVGVLHLLNSYSLAVRERRGES